MITGVVLARNEQAQLAACLQSLRPHVEQLFLIDMESTDRTVELASALVDRVLHHPLVPNFDSARNLAVPEARFDWLWFLDADERVPPETGRLVRQLLRERGHELAAITIPFKTYFAGKWIAHCGWWPGYTMPRVLKRGCFRFRDELHSGVAVEGVTLQLPPDPNLAIEHFSYRSVEHYIEKFNRYTTTEAGNRSARGTAPDWRRGIREMIRDWWLYYERNEGHKDGYHGWVLSWLAGQYRWFTEAKLLDLADQQAAVAQAAVPAGLDEVLDLAKQELAALRGEGPRLPLVVHFRSPLADPSGYADDGRCLLKALALLDRPLTAEEIRWSDRRVVLSAAETGLFKALQRGRTVQAGVCVTNCIPTLYEPDLHAPYNVLRTTFETDRIPDGWLARLEAYDQIWVCSEHNRRAFRRGGAAPERIRVVPQAVDTSRFSPQGRRLHLPPGLDGRFVFLSVFDWQWRKGWDVLLRAYAEEFAAGEGAGLLLKISRAHGIAAETVLTQADQALQSAGQSLAQRQDIVLWDVQLDSDDMAALYHSADAFVLASRGEGWGRPYLEALASGLPVIGTTGSGQDEFLTESNCLRVATREITVPDEAARELPIYAGHRWREPDQTALRRALRTAREDRETVLRKVRQGLADVQRCYSIDALSPILESALRDLESGFTESPPPPVKDDQIRLVLEGELFAGHSFSNINEQLALLWAAEPQVGLLLKRVRLHPTTDERNRAAVRLLSYVDRTLPGGPDVTIRHAFPPNWERLAAGKWVHIQPWEFGHLPLDWLAPLRDLVDEIWAPSNYVRDVYVRSGVPVDKIHVIPWGIDPEVYRPDIPERILPTEKRFRFLFVGGTIARKGFDLALEAYLEEFTRADDVCLVVKDVGTQTFYRYGNGRDRILQVMSDARNPAIVYFDAGLTNGQRASLYAACHCLVAPYRGEGFGLPVLEAMACGLPPIIPRGGPTDDFCQEEMAFFLPSHIVPCPHDWELCGPPTELAVDLTDVRHAMRQAYENQSETHSRGRKATAHARECFTWQQSVAMMTERLRALTAKPAQSTSPKEQLSGVAQPRETLPIDLSVCVLTQNCDDSLADYLARVQPFVREIVVGDLGSQDQTVQIAAEYGARTIDLRGLSLEGAQQRLLQDARCEWSLLLPVQQRLHEADIETLAARIASAGPSEAELEFVPAPANGHQGSNESMRILRTRTQAGAGLLIPKPNVATLSPHSEVARSRQLGVIRAELRAHPGELSLRRELARAHFLTGNYFHAECYLSDVLAANDAPSDLNRQALSRLIVCHARTGDPYRAAEFREAFVRRYDEPPPRIDEPKPTTADGLRLYLGAGQKRLAGYTHVDIVSGDGIDIAWDLDRRPWPWPDHSADVIVAEDLVEHLTVHLIEFCDEAWRVLRPDGELYVRTPHYAGESSWIDPTHRWHLHEQSFQYLDPATPWGRTYPHYTERKWQILSCGVRGPQNIVVVLSPRT